MPEIRLATLEDLDAVMAIERAAHAKPWSREFLTVGLSRDGYRVLLSIPEPREMPVSFLGFRVERDEAHVVNIATHPEHRRRGHAWRLLERLVTTVFDEGVRYLLLEVRRSNVDALGLYRRFGFRMIGAKPMYYSNDNEDALVMLLRLGCHGAVSLKGAP